LSLLFIEASYNFESFTVTYRSCNFRYWRL